MVETNDAVSSAQIQTGLALTSDANGPTSNIASGQSSIEVPSRKKMTRGGRDSPAAIHTMAMTIGGISRGEAPPTGPEYATVKTAIVENTMTATDKMARVSQTALR